MGASEVLKYIELVATTLAGALAVSTGLVALVHREQIARGERRRAEKRRALEQMCHGRENGNQVEVMHGSSPAH